MHLYAHDDKGTPVLAHRASKGTVYRCIECGTSVGLRKGKYRLPHFYHTIPRRKCRQNGKSHHHLKLQLSLEQRLSVGDVVLEKRFPEINRIADVVWEKEKLIFEVQCSPITSVEVKQRMQDYQSVGYRVIWILDERRFNKRRSTPLEHVLKQGEYYFADTNGRIYDQFRLIQDGVCMKKLLPLSVDISQVRRTVASLHFAGDITDRCVLSPGYQKLLEETREKYKKKMPSCSIFRAFFQFFRDFYMVFFRFFLERATR